MPVDYSGQNLRGRSFIGLDLAGANFSYADIRSADFTGAILTGASFSHVKAGLQKRWLAFLVLVSLLISGLAGFLSASVGELIGSVFNGSSLENQVSGWAALIAVIIVFIVIIRQGLNSAIAISISIAGAVAIALVGAVAVVKPITSAVAVAGAIAFVGSGGVAIAGSIALVVAVTGVITGAMVGAIAVAIAGATGGAGAGSVALIGALLSVYISRRALEGDEKYALIRDIAVAVAAVGGTSFRSCDLTDADFTEAILKSTDFRKATLTRTCFQKAKKLDRVRPGSTYLQKSHVCLVLVAGLGQDKNFDRLYLRGVNFKNARLVDASFIGADLSGANLQDADLSRAKLQQTQLDGTDFTGATLTGAYIQDWNITSDTKFDGVRCEYVYMRVPTKENPDPLRKPDNNKEVFGDGEFGDFIKPIFDTLDLYHNQGVDPRAIAISFKQLTENHPDAELRIVGMEVRGEDKFLIKAKTATQTDKSELSAEYFETYKSTQGLTRARIEITFSGERER
ncbi:pentapeptide repeat-containing protein [Tolypothrix bouteillei VB521301_2]|uniref:pentapeptide repeat-containing protein n=1 Tax=Tolypothrix bouteillei TaxID=1246981 RepID=UPI0038B4E1EB